MGLYELDLSKLKNPGASCFIDFFASVPICFIEPRKQDLGIKTRGRDVLGDGGSLQLMEPAPLCGADFDAENGALNLENIYIWGETGGISTSWLSPTPAAQFHTYPNR